MKNSKAFLDRTLGWFVVLLMALAVVNVLWQIFARFILNDPSSFTDELARFLLIWIGLLGAAYAAGQRAHLAIDLISTKISPKGRHRLAMGIQAAILIFALFALVIGGFHLVRLTLLLGQISAALQVPLGYVYIALPLSGLLMIVYAGYFITDHWQVLTGRKPHLELAGPSPPTE